MGWLEGHPVELLDGEVIVMAAMNPPHFVASGKTADKVRHIFSTGYIICDAKPIALSENSEPEPDITVVRGQWDDFGSSLPAPSVVALAIEISATTLTYDLERKADLYARSGIADYWVLDVENRRLIVHREPRDGKYQSVQTLKESDTIAPLEKPDASIQIVDLLP